MNDKMTSDKLRDLTSPVDYELRLPNDGKPRCKTCGVPSLSAFGFTGGVCQSCRNRLADTAISHGYTTPAALMAAIENDKAVSECEASELYVTFDRGRWRVDNYVNAAKEKTLPLAVASIKQETK